MDLHHCIPELLLWIIFFQLRSTYSLQLEPFNATTKVLITTQYNEWRNSFDEGINGHSLTQLIWDDSLETEFYTLGAAAACQEVDLNSYRITVRNQIFRILLCAPIFHTDSNGTLDIYSYSNIRLLKDATIEYFVCGFSEVNAKVACYVQVTADQTEESSSAIIQKPCKTCLDGYRCSEVYKNLCEREDEAYMPRMLKDYKTWLYIVNICLVIGTVFTIAYVRYREIMESDYYYSDNNRNRR